MDLSFNSNKSVVSDIPGLEPPKKEKPTNSSKNPTSQVEIYKEIKEF